MIEIDRTRTSGRILVSAALEVASCWAVGLLLPLAGIFAVLSLAVSAVVARSRFPSM